MSFLGPNCWQTSVSQHASTHVNIPAAPRQKENLTDLTVHDMHQRAYVFKPLDAAENWLWPLEQRSFGFRAVPPVAHLRALPKLLTSLEATPVSLGVGWLNILFPDIKAP